MQQFWSQYWWTLIILFIFFSSFYTINQGFIGVITMFGRYQRIARPGLRMKLPLIESVHKRVSIQNRSVELEFQAVTQDQANVYFKSMLLYSVQNADEETIKKVGNILKIINRKTRSKIIGKKLSMPINSFELRDIKMISVKLVLFLSAC